MHEDKFIERVGEHIDEKSWKETEKNVAAFLETLGERLDKAEQENLAAQLSGRLKEYLMKRIETRRFLLEDFYTRVGSRADVGYPQAVKISLGVASVLQEAVAPGEIEDILTQLPEEFGELFGRIPPGPLSPTV